MTSLDALVRERGVLVCCGTGGVGKTTTAAVLALAAARAGRDAIVVTIDPAKRLADTLGLEELGNVAHEIPRERWDPKREAKPGGRLSALMLDTRSTFDALVGRYASTPEQSERILENRFYRNVAGALSGTQEYMAMEKLFELHDERAQRILENRLYQYISTSLAGTQEYMAMEKLHAVRNDTRYDLVVLDTPPTSNALDFLDAPARLTRLLDNRVFRFLMVPARTGLRVAGVAVQAFFRAVGKVVGSETIEDVVAFFRAFEGMEQGFRDRASMVTELLAADETGFVLVTSPRRDSVEEAEFFAERLRASGLGVAGLVVNRVHPQFETTTSIEALRARAEELAAAADTEEVNGDARAATRRLAARYANLADYAELGQRERTQLDRAADRIGASAVARVPSLAHDVVDFDALDAVAEHLLR
jgi:anion-transporting  ArsA/GET3 family ATPase